MLNKKLLRNEKGMAIIEIIPIIIVVAILINFSIGFFGVVHTGILNNIAARNYTFETFRNRSDLTYHIRTAGGKITYRKNESRFSGIVSEKQSVTSGWWATTRQLAFVSNFGGTNNDGVDLSKVGKVGGAELTAHQQSIPGKRFIAGSRTDTSNIGVNSVWIKTVYGICLDSACGE